MKFIKSYKLFESTWTPEEFIQELTYYLSQYNLTVVYIRELLSKYDINYEIESGKTPLEFSKQLISDLDLDQRNKDGFVGVAMRKPRYDIMKYL